MISFDRISISNFRAYKDVAIEFESKNGVYLISGDNNTGKSTFLNAINWCLYGDTPFYTVDDVKEVVSLHAPEGTIASVEIYATIRGTKYRFFRSAKKSNFQGTLSVATESNGNWAEQDYSSSLDAVRRILPKDLRHLFFFNGENLKDIFSTKHNENDLKSSVYKVSEINLIDKAIEHLSIVELGYLREIAKKNKFADKIKQLEDNKNEIESNIEGHTQVITETRQKIDEKKRKIDELDKLIKDTAQARLLIEKRDDLSKRIKDFKIELSDLEFSMAEKLQENFHKVLLYNDFSVYADSLVNASKKGQIPPPIDPHETAKILDSGVCICNRPIGDTERHFIENQHKEFERLEELSFLTEGIPSFDGIRNDIPKIKNNYTDKVNDYNQKQNTKAQLEIELNSVNTSLQDIDEAKMHDDPQLRRSRINDSIEKLQLSLGFDASNKDKLIIQLKQITAELERTIQKDDTTQRLDNLRKRAETLRQQLYILKDTLVVAVRDKLQRSLWETFSSILPNTDFTEIKLNEDFLLSMPSRDGVVYNPNIVSVGTVKVLGLSLAHALSKDMGYTDVPFLIDNLYGNIKETHFEEITKMVTALAPDKQIIIMDLNIESTEAGFPPEVIAGKFMLVRNSDESNTTIRKVNKDEI
ncbi:MAG TPA: AAA family ATPase [Candidatus Saccharibacteria bacterium]|nr:AAA family ATPase [Candidatus Saccharibacteria bacterium]